MSGHPAAIHQGFEMLRSGGRASLLGIPKDPVTFDLVNDVIFKGATVQGIYGRKMFETWVQMTELAEASGRLNLEPLFHERLPLDKIRPTPSRCWNPAMAGKILFYPNGVRAEVARQLIFATWSESSQGESHELHAKSASFLHDAARRTESQRHLYFKLNVLDGEQKPVANFDGKEVINLSSNNYLGLTTHPKLTPRRD